MTIEPPPPLRFDCPACHASLTVPGSAAGIQGPCPKCSNEIISPDPATGRPARVPKSDPPAPSQDPVPKQSGKSPEPEAEPRTTEPQSPKHAVSERRSALPLAMAFMLTALIFAVGGFVVGKSNHPSEKEDPNTTSSPPPSDPTPTIVAEVEKKSPPEEVADPPLQPNPQDVLQQFLNAPTWKARAEHVLLPAEVELAMMKHAADFGDGPIKTNSIALLEVSEPNHVFKICTSRIPEGYPMVVSVTEEGPKVDWESFIQFHDDHFKNFIDGPAGRTGHFSLLVKPDPNVTEAGNFIRYILSVPMPNRETTAYIRKDSVASARLLALFDRAAALDDEDHGKKMEAGFPAVLTVAKRQTEDGRNYFEIEDLVAADWGPTSP